MAGVLYVAPEFLSVLARIQNNVSADIESAINATAGISQTVSITHGSFCSLFNNSLTQFETIRSSVGTNMQAVNTQIADNLHIAASAYLDADEQAADSIHQVVFV